jgi:hypothetical protein
MPPAPTVEEVSEEGIQPAHDVEKTPTAGISSNVGDQIPHELLEELAPNGEGEYILGKINEMSEEEALAIVEEAHEFFSDDWNLPTDMRERMAKLLKGPKVYGEYYERDLKIDAVMVRWSSPYPGVRSVAELQDNENVPIETFRAYFLGVGWAVIGTFMATFFNSRFPAICKSLQNVSLLH